MTRGRASGTDGKPGQAMPPTAEPTGASEADHRRLRYLSLIAAVTGVIVTAASVVLSAYDVKGRPAALVGVAIAVAGAVGLLSDHLRHEGERRRAARTRRRDWVRQVSGLLALGLPLPQVQDVDPFSVGVFDSRIARAAARPGEEPPYVARATDKALDEALVGARFVLVSGPVKAGKSRAAFEALRRVLPNHRLLVPRYDAPLRELINLAPWQDLSGDEEVVLWLDDVESWLGQGGLDMKLLNQLIAPDASPRVQVVATIRSEQRVKILEHLPPRDAPFEQWTAQRSALGEARRVLDWVELDSRGAAVRLSVELTDKERLEAKSAYPSLELFRLGRELAGTDELVTLVEFRAGEAAETGWAFVRAAADWERVGMPSAISEEDLFALAGGYDKRLTQRPTLGMDALAWALQPVDSGAALLERVRDEPAAYAAFDFIVDVLNGVVEPHDKLALPVGEHAWTFALARAAKSDLMRIGQAIVYQSARPAGMASANAGEAALESKPSTAYALGWVREQRKNWDGAEAAYKRGLAQGAPLGLVRAKHDLLSLPVELLYGLIRVRLHKGDALAAEALLAHVDRAHPRLNPEIPEAVLDRVRPRGVFPYERLAFEALETDEGVQRRAAELFSRAMNSRVAGLRATGQLYAAALRQRFGDLAGAEDLYRQAKTSEVTDVAERGALSLAVLRLRSEELATAEPMLRSLSSAIVPSVAATAHVALALVLVARGKRLAANSAEEARHYRHRFEEDPPGFGRSELTLVCGLLSELQGDLVGARRHYESLLKAALKLGEDVVGNDVVAEVKARLADPSLQG